MCLLLFQVYAASNVELITRTRTDHLSDQNKNKTKGKLVYTVKCTSLPNEHQISSGCSLRAGAAQPQQLISSVIPSVPLETPA